MPTTRFFAIDTLDNPVPGATVTVIRQSDGQSFTGITDVSGQFVTVLDTGKYTLSVRKFQYSSPAPVTAEVADPPDPTAAFFRPPAQVSGSLISPTRSNLVIGVDGGVPVTISLDSPLVTTATDIATRINTVLGASIASAVLDEVRLTSDTIGSSAEVFIQNDGTVPDPAMDLVWGLTLGDGDISVVGEDTPDDHNDFEVQLTQLSAPVSTDPRMCVISGYVYGDQPEIPIGQDAQIMIKVLPFLGPSASLFGVDLGNQFYITPDENGYVEFTVVRGARVKAVIFWMDIDVDFDVPNSLSADFMKLISPYVESVEFPYVTLSLDLGKSSRIRITGTKTSEEVLPLDPYSLESVDEDIVSSFSDGKFLYLTAESVGSTQVTAKYLNSRGEFIETPPITVFVI